MTGAKTFYTIALNLTLFYFLMTQAVIKTGGKQYLVQEGQQLKIEKINQKSGETVLFQDVLLVFNETSCHIGQPTLRANVEAKILNHEKAKKIIVFKYKPKKRYKVKKGHRQPYTLVKITKINFKPSPKNNKNTPRSKKTSKKK